jgi:hypothetical protein
VKLEIVPIGHDPQKIEDDEPSMEEKVPPGHLIQVELDAAPVISE